MSSNNTHRGGSRRDFLKGVGAAGAGLAAASVGAGALAPGAAAAGGVHAVPPGRYWGHGGAPRSSVDFGRIFPSLPPFAEASDTVRAALLEVGMAGGIMDAG